MSKMSQLATAIDELIEAGKELTACGDRLVKVSLNIRAVFDESSQNDTTVTVPVEQPDSTQPDAGPPNAASPTPATEPVTYTREEVRAMLAELSTSGHRAEAKALVQKYSSGGSLAGVSPESFPALVAEVEALRG